jgi:hypothetical protein
MLDTDGDMAAGRDALEFERIYDSLGERHIAVRHGGHPFDLQFLHDRPDTGHLFSCLFHGVLLI